MHLGAAIALYQGGVLVVEGRASEGGLWGLVALCAGLYFVRMFAITGVYHRYFSHRTYKTSRAMQLVLAVLGAMAAQKGPLWWASAHRLHHRHSDTESDLHSPRQRGFWHSHAGWWLGDVHETAALDMIPDFAGYPELRWMDRYNSAIPMALAAVLLLAGGWSAFLWGFCLSTVLVAHGTFTINSLAHVWGSRRFRTTDDSRNNLWLALLTMGEGWHNNHHHYMNSARQGFMWWEIDVTYYILWGLSKLGLIWDLKAVPAHALKKNLIEDEQTATREPPPQDLPDARSPGAARPILPMTAPALVASGPSDAE
jgi:stearoyl-CoA desaturase (Delta-9 desaturase)